MAKESDKRSVPPLASRDLRMHLRDLLKRDDVTVRDVLVLFLDVVDALDDIEVASEMRSHMGDILGPGVKVKHVTPEEFDRLFGGTSGGSEKPPAPKLSDGPYL